MNRTIGGLVLLLLALASPARAERVVATFKADQLKIADQPGRTLVLTVEKPGITAAQYELRGKLAFEGVQEGYLELLNYFPGSQVFFTRSLAASGPLGVLKGSSKAHTFELPFNAKAPDGKILHPERLEVWVVLPKGGKVRFQSAELVELEAGEAGWYTPQQAGLLGGAGGSLLGCLGALMGLLAQKGRGRTFVLGTARLAVALGAVVLVAGLLAVARSQPYHVFYPLLLMGFLMTAVFGGCLTTLTRRYTEIELRRMQAMDLVG